MALLRNKIDKNELINLEHDDNDVMWPHKNAAILVLGSACIPLAIEKVILRARKFNLNSHTFFSPNSIFALLKCNPCLMNTFCPMKFLWGDFFPIFPYYFMLTLIVSHDDTNKVSNTDTDFHSHYYCKIWNGGDLYKTIYAATEFCVPCLTRKH